MAAEKTLGNVSPSWLKSIYNGKCPRRLAATMITKQYSEDISNAAINKGIRFEYLCIGTANENKAYNGTTPLTTEKTGKISADEQKATDAAILFRKFTHKYKVEFIELQPTLHIGNTKAIPDFIGTMQINGETKTIAADLKYSSLLGNKWDAGGWHTDKFVRNDFTNQYKDFTNLFAPVLVYTLGAKKQYNFDYYLYIVASDTDFQVFAISKATINDFSIEVNDTINQYRELFYEPVLQSGDHFAADTKANFKNCEGCPLSNVCNDYTNTPTVNFL